MKSYYVEISWFGIITHIALAASQKIKHNETRLFRNAHGSIWGGYASAKNEEEAIKSIRERLLEEYLK